MKEIVVAGLGPGSMEDLSCGVWQVLNSAAKIFLRTGNHPVVEELAARGLSFSTFDYLYEEKESFSEVYDCIAESLLKEFEKSPGIERVIYAVPGHPLAGESSVSLLIKRAGQKGIKVTLKQSLSFLDALINALQIDPTEGLLVLDSLGFVKEEVNPFYHIIFAQVYSRLVASDLKLALLEIYPPHHPVTVVQAAGSPGKERKIKRKLCELDHGDDFDHLTSVYIRPDRENGKHRKRSVAEVPLDPLVNILDTLLSPEGCPWDREQGHNSLKSCLLEEAYEVIEAIDSKDMNKLREELGDLLLQVVFHSALAKKRGDFDCNDVIRTITEKMIRRHPHVFGDISVKDSAEVLVNWDRIKAAEQGSCQKERRPGIFDNLNKAVPALMLAEEVQKKAAKVGFDWPEEKGAWDKLYEEINEFKQACLKKTNREEELGDLLFAVVNIARFAKVCPETALLAAAQKFIRRIVYIEERLYEKEIKWEQMVLEDLDILWEKAKKAGF